MWLLILAVALPELHHMENDTLIFGSVNQFLDDLSDDESPDFFPVYGQLNWKDLLAFRTRNANLGTIYHPDCKSNYLEPHYLYSGATGFLRHDLYHQKVITQLPKNIRNVFALLHRSEEKIIQELNDHFFELTDDGEDALYTGLTLKHPHIAEPVLTKILSLLQTERQEIKTERPTFSWEKPGQHELMFPGYFADMDISTDPDSQSQYKEEYLAEVIIEDLGNILAATDLQFRTTLTLYLDRMIEALIENSDELINNHAIDANSTIEHLLNISAE